MRIRKNAKISPLLYSSSSDHSLLQSGLCQLNQSPWDVIIFPPAAADSYPYQQVDGDDCFTGNGSVGDSTGAIESVASMKISNPEDRIEDTVFCCQNDREGWQCSREAKEGHSYCEHHLSHHKNSTTSKKSDKPATNRRRPRAKKSLSAANPHEIYYYSGFGPRWRKKRGSGTSEVLDAEVEAASITPPSSNLSHFDTQQLVYFDDDDDDEDDENEGIGVKRVRKPIKARSLKSLM